MRWSRTRRPRRAVAPNLAVTTQVVDGPAAPALLDRAARDVPLVVGEQGVSGFEGASRVGGHRRGGARRGPGRRGPRDEPTATAAPVVVGVDGSTASEAAIDFAAASADAVACPLIAVHTWWDPFVETVPEELLDREAICRRRAPRAGRTARGPDGEVPRPCGVHRCRALAPLAGPARARPRRAPARGGDPRPRRLRGTPPRLGEPGDDPSRAVPRRGRPARPVPGAGVRGRSKVPLR